MKAAVIVFPLMIIPRQPQKPPRLLGHITELCQTAARADQIQQIAMRALGGILLMCNCT